MLDPKLQDIWNSTLALMENELPRPSFETWMRNARPLALYDRLFVIAVPSALARNYIAGKFAPLIEAKLSAVLDRETTLDMVVLPELEDTEAAVTSEAFLPQIDKPQEEAAEKQSQPLNPRYTFDTFVIGMNNRLAHAASLAVAEAPAQAYNPLFIYGGVGLGKTHLMQAIAHHVIAKPGGARVIYISSETFANEMIDAIRDRKTVEFRNRYRYADVLLVDDIQFLAGKEQTQEEFFHTFNVLHEANRQIVLASDRPPRDIPTLQERLRSRFEWGLISDIQSPDLETRIAILRKKAQQDRLQVPDDILEMIAERVQTNIRELEGALIRLVAFSSLHGQPITTDLAEAALRDIVPEGRPRHITIRRIMELVAEYYSLDVRDLKVRKRTRALAFPRQIAMYLARELTDSSLPRIGEEFGGRDHTTVMHAHEKISQDLKRDPALRAVIQALRKQIAG